MEVLGEEGDDMEEYEDEDILLQFDGYKSYLNALEKIDIDGRSCEVVSSSDCTDLC